ncbi:unnamed protein product (macronuclear) [Paramecium tetraurelia]|uniref:Protein kinase domain-containing protein n=1 Tax=Paramecium tetraurelia TaxID=5888 RepID=A0BZV2_PARTE|nr:uncharacterized protein GSPATT00005921001 [Paramecium tetraurelia]CAK64069.1 unnamed protein product [Paramecium tetraurelia]|eukprot:XP_001431467.1 hypothetical protein (macronuclear) [Paramecium tetraurelia strain d4-2]
MNLLFQISNKCYDAFQKAYQQEQPRSVDKISEDNRKFLILNKDTGLQFDCRNLENLEVPVFDLKEVAWKNYWKQSREISDQLLQCVQHNDKDKVIELLSQSDVYIDINIKDYDDWTPLHFACQQNNLEIVQFLLNKEANPKSLSLDKKSPLHIASIKNNSEICELLINYGANLDEQDSDLNTPLHIASKYGNEKVCQILLEKNGNHESKNNQSLTPIELASDINIIEVFNRYGISLNNFTYTRTVIKEQNLILQNSRRDHVERILKLTQKRSKKPSANTAEPNNDQRVSIIVSDTRSAWNKIVNLAASFYRVPIKGNNLSALSEIEQNRIGPQSFQFYQKLGEGGFGEVYLVEKIGQLPKKYYAMKILKKEDINTSNIMKSAQIEKDVLKMMNHPFIVKLNWAFQTSDHLYLVMDLCSGGDLATHLELLNSYPEAVVKIFAAEITLALEELHSQGIIFRDLKPENVVLDADGHALLTDFGLSKSGIDEEILNQSFCGTLAYLAPEMLMKKGHGRQVDWYMLGILIYELLVGAPPYYDSEKEVLKENIKKAPLRIPKSLSQEAKDIIIKLLIRDPKKRLGCKEDAKEIKNHPWFNDIDWQDCYNKKLQPPKPLVFHRPQDPRKITFSKISTKNKLEDWTFFEN